MIADAPNRADPPPLDPPEIAVSAAWHGQRFSAPLRTVDGHSVEVVHRGVWSHGFGPDFRDALLLFEGRELRAGSVEVHRRTSGWAAHGHARDPRYDDVVLHVVLTHDGAETRRHDGALVPVLELRGRAAIALDARFATADWGRFGGDACAPELVRANPEAVRIAILRLGDTRLAGKAARIEAQLTGATPGDVLYREIWDGLGYSANREPMRAVAERLPLAAIEAALTTAPPGQRLTYALALLFGVAGFLPLAPVDATFAGLTPSDVAAIEAVWATRAEPWRHLTIAPTAWTRARVRPANHPAARLAAGAALLAHLPAGLVPGLLAPIRAGHDPIATLRERSERDAPPGLGADRAAAIVANAVIPFALALAEHTGDRALSDAAALAWERIPAAEPNAVTRRALRQVAGDARLPGLGARGQQGLLHLDAALCSPRRCFECPVAHLALTEGGGTA